jgi:signal peptidase I
MTTEIDRPPSGDEDDDVTGEPARPAQRSFVKSAREWLIVVVIAITAAVVMKVFVVQQFYVSGHSMDTTLHDLDRVLVNKLSYDLHDPNRGDVVVLEEGIGAAERDLIKRVIALPGETIEIKNCVVYIDDRELVEPYLDPAVATPTNCGAPNFGPLTIEDHHVFVMGDNRPNSGDSRGSLGPVDYDKIVGRAFVVIWPRDHWQWL